MKTKKRWIPEEGKKYFYIGDFEVYSTLYHPFMYKHDRCNIIKGNCFKTRKEVMSARKKILEILKK